MTRQNDLDREVRQLKKDSLLIRACEFELVGSLASGGATLLGFSVKLDPDTCLLTLRAFVDDMRQVAFVSSDTLPDCLRKCVKMAYTDRLKWKQDKWANDQT